MRFGALAANLRERLRRGAGGAQAVAQPAQLERQQAGDVGVVLDRENPDLHANDFTRTRCCSMRRLKAI